MPTLEIGGKRVKVGDEFLRMSPEDQQNAVVAIGSELGLGGDTGEGADTSASPRGEAGSKVGAITADNLVRAAARGIPIAGGAMDQFAALMDAATQPVLGRGSTAATFAERRKANLEAERAKDKAFDEESPIASTGAKVVGGVAPFFAAAKVPALAQGLGMTGPLRQQVLLGGASGGAIGAADAAVRGEDIGHAAETNAMFGSLAPVAARGLGKAYTAVRDRFTPTAAPVAQNTIRIGNVDVPVPTSVAANDPAAGAAELARAAAAASKEEAARKGAMGEPAQKIALGADEETSDALRRASEGISAGLDPTGARVRTTPQDAGGRVVQEAIDAEAARLAAAQAAEAAATGEGAAARAAIGGTPATAGEGAEAVARGVPAARDAAAAARTAAYKQAETIPIEAAPELRNVGETVRHRLQAADDPIWVDPNTSPNASKALSILSDAEGGVFANRAAPAGGGPAADTIGVAPATQPAVVPAAVDPHVARVRAEAAALRAKYGDDVARKYEEQQLGAGPAGGVLAAHDVAVPGRGPIALKPRVVEAGDVRASSDEGYDQALQPRNRDRAASQRQVDEMAAKLDPKRLGASSEADRGAPIIGPDGMVESGNGRVMALRKVYAEGGEKAAAYRKWLSDQGVDVSAFKNPVLVRERITPMSQAEREAFTVQANQSSGLTMTAHEKALADAKLLSDDALGSIRNPDLGAVENRGFVRQFFSKLPQTEQAALMTAKGDLSSEGLARVRNAVLAKAFGDSPVLARVAESTSDEIRSISTALTAAAPEWASLRAAIDAGAVPKGLDITKQLLDAVARTARVRGKGGSLESAMAQSDAFGAQSDESKRLMRLFYDADGKRAASSSQISDALRNYAQEALKVDAAPGLGLGLPQVTAADLLENAAKRVGAPAAIDKAVSEAATAAKPPPPPPEIPAMPLDAKAIEAGRKRLVSLYTAAREAAARSGVWSDVRAMRRIMGEYDAVIKDMAAAGKITGDVDAYLGAIEGARASHAQYRELFTRRGANDPIGAAVEKIIGRFGDTAASPDEIAKAAWGSVAAPGGGQAARVTARLKKILSPDDFKQTQQGLFSYLVEKLDGGMRPAEEIAKRVDAFLNSSSGSELAKQAFTQPQRAQLARYADAQRGLAAKPLDPLDKFIAKIAGTETGIPMSGADVVNELMKHVGVGHKQYSSQLVHRLKRDMTPDGFNQLRQGIFEQLIEKPSAGEFGPQALASRMKRFLDDPMAAALYAPDEIAQMKQLKALYERMIPPKGSAPNTSNTAMTLARLAQKGQHNVLALIGAGSGGIPGAILGSAIERGGQRIINKRAAKEATGLFYGAQPSGARSAAPDMPLAIAVTRGAVPEFLRD